MLFDSIHVSKTGKQYIGMVTKSLCYKATIKTCKERQICPVTHRFKEQLITEPFRQFRHIHRKGNLNLFCEDVITLI